MTHAELVVRAARWLRTAKRCQLVLSEIGTSNEQPDAIGWGYGAIPHLVECKTSVDDYRKDAKKWFRRAPDRGLGRFRWFFAPPNVAEAIASHMHSLDHGLAEGFVRSPSISISAVRWGVVTCLPRGCRILRKPMPFDLRNEAEESRILVSACRRAIEGWGRKVFGELAPPLVDGDPHPTTAKVIKALRDENRRLRRQKGAALDREGAPIERSEEPRRYERKSDEGHGGYTG